jgi:hypothetical protein
LLLVLLVLMLPLLPIHLHLPLLRHRHELLLLEKAFGGWARQPLRRAELLLCHRLWVGVVVA